MGHCSTKVTMISIIIPASVRNAYYMQGIISSLITSSVKISHTSLTLALLGAKMDHKIHNETHFKSFINKGKWRKRVVRKPVCKGGSECVCFLKAY